MCTRVCSSPKKRPATVDRCVRRPTCCRRYRLRTRRVCGRRGVRAAVAHQVNRLVLVGRVPDVDARTVAAADDQIADGDAFARAHPSRLARALICPSSTMCFGEFRRVRWCCPITSRTSTGSTPTTGIRCRRLQGPQRHRTRLQRRQPTARPSHPLRQPGHRLPRSRRPTNHHHSCSRRKI